MFSMDGIDVVIGSSIAGVVPPVLELRPKISFVSIFAQFMFPSSYSRKGFVSPFNHSVAKSSSI